MPETRGIEVNGRGYQLPRHTTVVVCVDGCEPDYIAQAVAAGAMPWMKGVLRDGTALVADCVIPSFTNPNNLSIVTGVPPSVHGISGNFFYDSAAGEEVMMNSGKFLRCETIFPAAARAGRKVAVVTAKEKLRDIFAAGLFGVPPAGGESFLGAQRPKSSMTAPAKAGTPSGIAFSSEKAGQAGKGTHGIEHVDKFVGQPTPPIYSAEASLYVLRAGAALIERGLADLLYLSTTDFVQHKFPPEAPEALDFYAGIDEQLGRLLKLGAVVGLTADHGMNAKQKPDGSPNVIYLERELTERYGPGFRVILPITDPYVVHHGALGSFAVVHLPPGVTARRKFNVLHFLNHLPGVTEVYGRNAAEKLELPADRLGDFVVMSGRDVVLGRTPESHDLKAVERGLRSHGGRYEEMVPFAFSEALTPAYAARAAGDPRNFDVFDFVCNGTRA